MRKNYFILFVLMFITSIILNIIFLPSKAAVQTNTTIENNTIIIDAGHGGFDGGAVAGDGTVEKNINLNIAKMLGNMLSLNGINVVYTRTEDTGTNTNETDKIALKKKSDLQNRLNLMKEYPDSVFVSIHLNKFTTSSAKGAQVFYSDKHEKAKILAQYIQNGLVSHLQPNNDRIIKQGTKDTYLLYNAHIPAVIVECGFLSNKNELELLKTKEYQVKVAFSIFSGISEFYNKE